MSAFGRVGVSALAGLCLQRPGSRYGPLPKISIRTTTQYKGNEAFLEPQNPRGEGRTIRFNPTISLLSLLPSVQILFYFLLSEDQIGYGAYI